MFCIYLQVSTVHIAVSWLIFSHDTIYFQPEISLQPQRADISSFCCLVLNGTTVLRGRLTVCLEDLWVICWPVIPSLNLTAVMRHSFHNVVIKKKDKTLIQDVKQKINLFSVERRECLVDCDKRVSVCQWCCHAWRDIQTTFPERSLLGHLCGQPPQNSVSTHIIMPVGKKRKRKTSNSHR